MEALRVQSPKSSVRSILSPLRSRSPSGAGRKRASPLASRSGSENENPNTQIEPPNSPSSFTRKALPHPTDGLPLQKQSGVADELRGSDGSLDPSGSSVKVVVRLRSGSGRKTDVVVRKISSNSLSLGDRSFNFHSVLGPESTQEDVFKMVGIPLVNYSLAGFNTSIVSYGQTGSGKTYTMWGPAGAMVDDGSTNSEQGIAPRLFKMLFSEIHRKQDSSEAKQLSYQCRCSFLEIHNDQINDLLDPTQRNLQIRDDPKNGSHVENLTDEYVTTIDDITQLLVKGLTNRKVGTTSMNSKSSRSHIIFTCIVESWCKLSATKCFSNSKTSRIVLADLAGSDDGIFEAAGSQCLKERKHIKKSLAKLGKLVNILGEAENSLGDKNITYYTDSCLTHLLKDTLGGNAKAAVICAICPDESSRSGTLSTLRFGERAKHVQNKPVINEITEDYVNDLSDQIRQLKEELMNTKLDEGKSNVSKDWQFNGWKGRQSLNLLRASLNRSLNLPNVDQESDEEMDVDEEDVSQLCVQLENLNSSVEDKSNNIDLTEESDRENNQNAKSVDANASKMSLGLSIPCQEQLMLGDPVLCSSPKVGNTLKRSVVAPEGIIRTSLKSSKANPTDSLAASLQRGLQMIDYHESSSCPRSSFVGLSFEHLASISVQKENVDASPSLCSACKNAILDNGCEDKQIVIPVNEDINEPSANPTEREKELEALCANQATTIKHLNSLIDNQKQEEEQHLSDENLSKNSPLQPDERAALLLEIETLKNQLKTIKDVSDNDSLLEQIRNGSTSSSAMGEDYEKEKQKWTESESRWICLTEELRVDLEQNRRLAEKKEMELDMEKTCTAELNDALQRSILGHGKIVEHYVELQETYDELLLKHRKIMEGIAEVKKAAQKAGRKGCGSAFAAALSAELSTLRIDREKERTYLKEQNRKLRIQLRDTAEAVHAAGELLVRLREAEAAAYEAEEKCGNAQQEVERMRKQMEKLKRKHQMELLTMKHFLAESRLPESALEPMYHHRESEITEEGAAPPSAAPYDDQSWRSAFQPSYQ
ncbi:kinesin-like protein KIN-12C [Zingiber officinale]|uniref:kinesin-like protein KIN-12C n=1 Tax=Zingiber officinale TaxID=94328 RepID=UPI001C4B3643|nr:kinesin-like protein KIN-12C [Zingiber officinale]